jgi:hypothetical protein
VRRELFRLKRNSVRKQKNVIGWKKDKKKLRKLKKDMKEGKELKEI